MRKSGAHNLTFDIVQKLGEAVVSGKYNGGIRFPTEADLCEEFGVSRSVMREAVKMLTSKGLLTARPRRGTEVTPEGQWNLLDPDVLNWLLKREVSLPLLLEFTQTRIGVEPEAAYLAAKNATADQVQKIEAAVLEMERAENGESDPLESDIAFHIAVLEASNNRFLVMLDSLIETTLRFSIRMTNRYKGVRIASVADHKEVYDAIRDGDSERAKVAMLHMLTEALKLFQKQLQQEGSL